jgi:hypothetical protein
MLEEGKGKGRACSRREEPIAKRRKTHYEKTELSA